MQLVKLPLYDLRGGQKPIVPLECSLDAALPFSCGGFVMALSKTGICDFGWKARDFALKGVDGQTYTLPDVRGPKGTLVVFICNHCPYVKASHNRTSRKPMIPPV
jgi:AhpC/TSA family